RRRNIALRMQPPQVVGLEVGDADRVRAALTVELAERMPGRDEISVVPRRQRPMNQEKVDIVETKRFQRLFERAAGVAWPMGAIAELCGDEYLIATQSRFRDGFADFLLVAVHLSSVDVPVAHLQRSTHGIDRVFRLDQKDAKAKLRNRLPVVQHDLGYR